VKACKFTVTPEMEETIHLAALMAPTGKATREDKLFAELFKIAPETTSPILVSIWRACGRLALIPSQWKRFNLIPLHKKESTALAKNYRPVALVSHARKIIEKAIDIELKKRTTFHRLQCAFRGNRSIEQAILRYIAAKKMRHYYTAVLD